MGEQCVRLLVGRGAWWEQGGDSGGGEGGGREGRRRQNARVRDFYAPGRLVSEPPIRRYRKRGAYVCWRDLLRVRALCLLEASEQAKSRVVGVGRGGCWGVVGLRVFFGGGSEEETRRNERETDMRLFNGVARVTLRGLGPLLSAFSPIVSSLRRLPSIHRTAHPPI